MRFALDVMGTLLAVGLMSWIASTLAGIAFTALGYQ
jgi:hypothetical protein